MAKMAWNEFLAIIPVVFDFVKGLNLPPRTTAIATTGIIVGIAYSYKYFRTNQLLLRKKAESENVLDDTPDTPVALLPDENDDKGDSADPSSTIYSPAQGSVLNVSKAKHVIGTIDNRGENQKIDMFNKYYNK